MMNMKKETQQIKYNNVEQLRAVLVGRRIVETRPRMDSIYTHSSTHLIEFVLDNNVVLEVRETEGCSCGYGDWSVANTQEAPSQVITNVDVVDEVDGNSGGDSATLRMFVYSEGIKTELVTSHGQDNGYYGWGYEVNVTRILEK